LSSGSEAEDPTGESHVQLAEHSGGTASTKMAVRLMELGPRIQFELVKVEADFFKGEVIYHSYVLKTPEEIKEQHRRIEKLNALKAARRLEQEKNVEKKKAFTKHDAREDDIDNLPQLNDANEGSDSGNDDATWYKKEVGEEPDDGLFAKSEDNKPHVKFIKQSKTGKQAPQQIARGRQQKRVFKQTNGTKNNKRRKPM